MIHCPPISDEWVYKIFRLEDWDAVMGVVSTQGSAVDQRDGYIHFSTQIQVAGTLARHFGDASAVVLAAVRVAALPVPLRWEGDAPPGPFPHLYAPLPLAAVEKCWTLCRSADGIFPDPFVMQA